MVVAVVHDKGGKVKLGSTWGKKAATADFKKNKNRAANPRRSPAMHGCCCWGRVGTPGGEMCDAFTCRLLVFFERRSHLPLSLCGQMGNAGHVGRDCPLYTGASCSGMRGGRWYVVFSTLARAAMSVLHQLPLQQRAPRQARR